MHGVLGKSSEIFISLNLHRAEGNLKMSFVWDPSEYSSRKGAVEITKNAKEI